MGANNTPLLSQISCISWPFICFSEPNTVQRIPSTLCQMPGRPAVLALTAGKAGKQGKSLLLQLESWADSAQKGLQRPPRPEVPLHLHSSVDPQDLLSLHIPAWNTKAFMNRFPHAPHAFKKKPSATPSNLIAPRLIKNELCSTFLSPFITRMIIRQYRR